MKPANSSLHQLTRLDGLLASLLGLASLVLYIRTLAPGLLYGDSGEFQTLVYSLGMTHPTGYPVYLLLGRLFSLLPIGDPAWRVNLFSAVLASLSVTNVYLLVRLLAGWRLAGVTAAVTLAIAPLFWYFSVIAELYAPACAFLSGLLLFLLLWRQSGRWGWLAAAGLLGGLSLGVHTSVALAAPGVLVYLGLVTLSPHLLPGKERWKSWLVAASGVVVGIVLYLCAFLLLDARNPDTGYYHATIQPALSLWNMTAADFNSPFERLKFLLGARQFSYAMFSDPAATMSSIAGEYWQQLKTDFSPVSLILAGIGLVSLFIRRWREAVLLVLGWGVAMFFIINYDIFDITALFVPTYVFLVAWIGIGLGILLTAIAWVFKRLCLNQVALPAALLLGVGALVLTLQPSRERILTAWQAKAVVFMRNTGYAYYPYNIDMPQAAQTQAQLIVNAVEDDAIVFVHWDLLFPCYYVADGQNRTGIDFHETYAQEGISEVGESAADYIAENMGERLVYFLELPVGPQMSRFQFKPVHREGISLYQVAGLRP